MGYDPQMDAARTVGDPPPVARKPAAGGEIREPRPPPDPEGTGRYKQDRVAAPPRRRMRAIRAYWVTMVVIASYLWLRLRAKLHDDAWVERRLTKLHIRNARRIERGICMLQGLFIKVGQLISIMTNFLPEQFRRELEGLQDAVPPRPYEEIERRIREELGAGPDELFASFEHSPIASAS